MRAAKRLLTMMVALCACVAASVSGAQAADRFEYVALGDSAAAGPLIPEQDINLLCLRSDRNYPAVVAERLGAELTDVSCSGATVEDFGSPRFGIIPPQYKALKPSTDLVTVTVGANDVGLFGTALRCINFLPEPAGHSCADRLTEDGRDTLAEAVDAWAPKFAAVLDEIGRRAPGAMIVVTGYPTYVRPDGCFPVQPVWARDANYLQSVMNRISQTVQRLARVHGAEYVDLAAITKGHDFCAAPRDRYVEGLVPTHIAAPIHPNRQGMAAFGKAVAGVVRSPS